MEPVIPDREYVLARQVLLDGLEALEPHLDALTLVGAQAVYLHTGSADLAVAPTTTDADIVLNSNRLGNEPLLEVALREAGFTPATNPGTWCGSFGVALDVMVPDALLAGTGGRRGARLPVHGNKVARRTVGLEPALIDNSPVRLGAFEPSDVREFTMKVAGPTALLIAKITKIRERLDQPARMQPKDGLDVLRILQAVDTAVLAKRLDDLLADEISRQVTGNAFDFLREHGVAATGVLAGLAVQAAGVLEDPDTISGSMTVLVDDLLGACRNLP